MGNHIATRDTTALVYRREQQHDRSDFEKENDGVYHPGSGAILKGNAHLCSPENEFQQRTLNKLWSEPLSLDKFGGEFRMPSGEKKGVVDERSAGGFRRHSSAR